MLELPEKASKMKNMEELEGQGILTRAVATVMVKRSSGKDNKYLLKKFIFHILQLIRCKDGYS